MGLSTLAFDMAHPCAIVDMGSNGIRFSISDLSGANSRVMPVLYHSRSRISLYDAQYDSETGQQCDIPDEIIEKVITEFKLFKKHCVDFGVPESNVKVLATEATRKASNSEMFRAKIKQETSWDVSMISKEKEGEVGAMGVASSFRNVHGLVMDLGGGSLQLTWILSTDNGNVRLGRGGSVSLPYGAAALLQRLESSKKKNGTDNKAALQTEIEEKLVVAYGQVREDAMDDSNDDTDDGIELYLSGGGFRGWGNICMDVYGQHTSSSSSSSPSSCSPSSFPSTDYYPRASYPIPIINGFSVSGTLFSDVKRIIKHVDQSSGIFRVSKRRAKQAHAVAVLVAALTKALPVKINRVHFSQGGVREGTLFSTMPSEIRAIAPINAATAAYAPRATDALLKHLLAAIPSTCASSPSSSAYTSPPKLITDLLRPTANMLYTQQPYHKEVRSAAALRSTTSGILSGFQGITHSERAALALILCALWGAKLPRADETFLQQLQEIVGARVSWWAKYIGAVAALVASVYPAGVVSEERLKLKATVATASESKGSNSSNSEENKNSKKKKHKQQKKKQHGAIILRVDFPGAADSDSGLDLDDAAIAEVYADQLKDIKKVGKKKNWVATGAGAGSGGEQGKGSSDAFGLKVKVRVKVYLPAHSAAMTVMDERRSESDTSDGEGEDEHEEAESDTAGGNEDEEYDMVNV